LLQTFETSVSGFAWGGVSKRNLHTNQRTIFKAREAENAAFPGEPAPKAKKFFPSSRRQKLPENIAINLNHALAYIVRCLTDTAIDARRLMALIAPKPGSAALAWESFYHIRGGASDGPTARPGYPRPLSMRMFTVV